jgi:UDP-glucose 4-epimerase
MKILLTGKTGFLGRHLDKFFSEKDVELHATVRRIEDKNGEFDHVLDLTDRYAVKSLLNDVQPEVIIHFAANPTTRLDEDNPTLITTNNMVSTQNLVHYAPENCQFIFASSILVYGDTPHKVTERFCPNPTSVYGASKLGCEGIISAYTNMGRIRGCSLRLSATVGSGLTHGILYDFMRKIFSDEPEFTILGNDPGSKKPFSHVMDVAKAVELAIVYKLTGKWNISPNDSVSARDIAELVMGISGIVKPITFLGESSTWAGDNKLLEIDGSAISELGLRKSYPTSTIALASVIKDIYETRQISR